MQINLQFSNFALSSCNCFCIISICSSNKREPSLRNRSISHCNSSSGVRVEYELFFDDLIFANRSRSSKSDFSFCRLLSNCLLRNSAAFLAFKIRSYANLAEASDSISNAFDNS